MNHPYLYPDQCEWLDDHDDLIKARKMHAISHPSIWFEDDGDFLSYESLDVI